MCLVTVFEFKVPFMTLPLKSKNCFPSLIFSMGVWSVMFIKEHPYDDSKQRLFLVGLSDPLSVDS